MSDSHQKLYAGIGSRETPEPILALMQRCAKALSTEGYILRSGGARGADLAFSSGAHPRMRIIYTAKDLIPSWAFDTVDKFHPAPDRFSFYARRLYARNAMILLGADGRTPVHFVLCWTPQARVTGGTGQALRIAQAHGIPVFNFANDEHHTRLETYANDHIRD